MQLSLLDLPWWGHVLVTLGSTHLTIASVTIFLHRHQAHRALELHPIASHFFRFWLWLTTGMATQEWVAIHRKHHARSDLADDSHSPQIHGIWKVLFEGAELYRMESKNAATVEKYGHGTPDDWIERKLYAKHRGLGVLVMLTIDLALFGPIGLTIWAVQMLWIPIFAAESVAVSTALCAPLVALPTVRAIVPLISLISVIDVPLIAIIDSPARIAFCPDRG